MDNGVEVIDFNTRFSGITPEIYENAILPLASVRKSLDDFIDSETIIIGHALENDLKTLRMIHHRRALKALAKEILGKTIQSGGAMVGHSSVEDSIATLDLVRWHVLNRPKPKPKPPASQPPPPGTSSVS
ncbi:Exonuclease GOR [Grifola frondosa]|uniref:Exonuclease GOR n=1 Tax=Grifola frondosa TaxID=5627 RepID=A0A1C7LZT4_GRIFR|nr:Exonuclease GOR [Grifola frondosa]